MSPVRCHRCGAWVDGGTPELTLPPTQDRATVQVRLCPRCTVRLEAFLAGPGTTEVRQVPARVELAAPEGSCRECMNTLHASCTGRRHGCACSRAVPHTRRATVLITALDDPPGDAAVPA